LKYKSHILNLLPHKKDPQISYLVEWNSVTSQHKIWQKVKLLRNSLTGGVQQIIPPESVSFIISLKLIEISTSNYRLASAQNGSQILSLIFTELIQTRLSNSINTNPKVKLLRSSQTGGIQRFTSPGSVPFTISHKLLEIDGQESKLTSAQWSFII
jgi:hypothetical protein